jgi:hypothetical protein
MKLKTMKSIMGWVIILLTIFSAVLIYFFQQFNILFLALLLFEIILVIRYRKIFSPLMIRVSQILIGLLFLFSGFSKAVDPLGTAYRIGDYLTAYHMKNDFGITIFLSFVLNTAELLLGGLLLLNIKPKITPWLVALMMGIFTLTTWYDAIYSPVPDCGCFGDAVIMTNWQTYYKNLAINVFVLIVIFGRLKIKSFFGNINGTLIRQYNVDKTGVANPSSSIKGEDTDAQTSIDWDLKNFAGIPIAGGLYLIHVKETGGRNGERVLKWFGSMRPVDLNTF